MCILQLLDVSNAHDSTNMLLILCFPFPFLLPLQGRCATIELAPLLTHACCNALVTDPLC